MNVLRLLYQAVMPGKRVPYINGAIRELFPAEAGQHTLNQAVFEEIFAHLKQAAEVGEQLDSNQHQGVMESLPVAVLRLRENGHLEYANPSARTLIDNATLFMLQDDQLGLVQPQHRLKLTQLFADSSDTPAHTQLDSSSERLQIISYPHQGQHDLRTLVISTDSQNVVNAEQLIGLYGFTQAEAKVAAMITAGQAPDEIANKLNKSVETVRSHLKSALRKSDSSRQTQLVSRVLTGIAPLLTPAAEPTVTETSGETIFTEDGRCIGFACYGPASGKPAMLFPSFRGSRLELTLDEAALTLLNRRIIIVERPGHGLSDPTDDLSYQLLARDVLRIADHLQISHFDVIGNSIGGYVALQTLPWLEKRVLRLLLISSTGSVAAMQADPKTYWWVQFYTQMLSLVPDLSQKFWFTVERKFADDEDKHKAFFADHSPLEVATVVDNPAVWRVYHDNRIEGSRTTAWGAIHDLLRGIKNSETDLRQITVPTEIWHGELDNQISPSQAAALQQMLPDARLQLIDNGGHYIYLTHMQRILTAFDEAAINQQNAPTNSSL